jgi:hypothetical protein
MSWAGLAAGGQRAGGQPHTRGRIHGSPTHGVNYPNPFFDVAHTYLPTTVKELFKYCRYYFLTNGLINATVFKLAEYPVTDIIIDHDNGEVKKRWEEYYHEHLGFRAFEVECGLDYNTYGNCIVSISYPFLKYLTCNECRFSARADSIRPNWTFTNYGFRLNCPACGMTSEAEVKEVYLKNASGIKLVRWNVEDIEISYNDVTGSSTYFYNIPGPLRSDIVIGKKDVVETVPQIFIQALRQQKGIVFSKDNLFHIKRPTIAWQDRGWGIPLILPVLKDAFYLQLMKKAHEAILLEHIVPLRVIFPQAAGGTSDPFTNVDLGAWKEQVSEEIARWRYDNNYIPILPLPMGNQSIGGDGKALLMSQEMQMQNDVLIMGMGVPREFLQGGLSYSGSNVSMRMLENNFLGYLSRNRSMALWVMKSVASYMGWPEVNIRFKPFKMADDIQRKAYLLQLNQAQKVSDTTLLSDADLSQEDEDAIMLRETDKRLQATRKQQIAMAEVQGEAQAIMMKYQAKAQAAAMQGPAAPGEAGGPEVSVDPGQAQQIAAQAVQQGGAPQQQGAQPVPVAQVPEALGMSGMPSDARLGGMPQEAQSQLNAGQNRAGGMDLVQMAEMYAQQISQMPPEHHEPAISALSAMSPELGQLVTRFLSMITREAAGNKKTGVDSRPLPEQRPERRTAASV